MAFIVANDISGQAVWPTLVLNYSTRRASRNVIHPVLGRPDPDVTLRPTGLRTGRLEMFFLTRAEAVAAEALHSGIDVLLFGDSDDPVTWPLMTYVVDGEVEVRHEADTDRWIVAVDFAEVAP